MSTKTVARKRMSVAQKATQEMDDLLIPALHELQRAVNDGNGAAIYFSHHRVRDAMAIMADNIKKAQEIYRLTAWPSDEDYDIA